MSVRTAGRPLAERDPDLRGREILVLGLGRSGLAAARAAAARGAQVTVADLRTADQLGPAAERARAFGARVHTGGHPPELAEAAELIVVSPGVPTEIDLLRGARRLGVPVWGEVELAARFCRGTVIAITGSNGKSTSTAMAGTILRGAGIPGGTGGNLGTPFCDLLELDGPQAVHALELSSFQLETVEAFRPDIAVVLNLSPDHLDRHPSFESYAAAKMRLLQVQAPDGSAILNADDPESRRFEAAVRGRLHRFSTRDEVDSGGFVRRGRLVLRTADGETELLDSSELPVRGEHNLANALAAALACRLAGCHPQAIASGLRAFRALPHRLEPVGSGGGVEFYNDSKATNPASTAMALSAFAAGRVHLILGGRDKGADWSPLLGVLERKVKQVLLVGEAAEMLARRLADKVPLVECGTVRRAVRVACGGAAPGDVVLLSPGCASFDQYRNFEERGDDFRRAVRSIITRGEADA